MENPGRTPRFFNQIMAGEVITAMKQANKKGIIIEFAARKPAINTTKAAMLKSPRLSPLNFIGDRVSKKMTNRRDCVGKKVVGLGIHTEDFLLRKLGSGRITSR